jgi:membrane protein implicated in regulation of membrane protease activity
MEYCCGFFWGGAVLDYFREAQEARMATPGRRIYNCASAAIILVVMALVFAGLVPLWIFWIAFPVSLGLDALLTRKWIREDALKGYRAGQPE